MKSYPMALGQVLIQLRKRFDVSKYAVANAAPQRNGRPLNHAAISRIEYGWRFGADYDTLQRIAQGIDAASEEGGITRGDRLSIFEAAFADRVTYEAAKFAVYYLYVLSEQDLPLHPALETLRNQILEEFPESGEDHDRGEVLDLPGRDAPRGPRSVLRVNLRTATGFEAVREMAEMHEAHALRLQLLIDVVPWISQDWEVAQLRIGTGELAREAFARSAVSPQSPQAELNGSGDSRSVRLWTDHIDE